MQILLFVRDHAQARKKRHVKVSRSADHHNNIDCFPGHPDTSLTRIVSVEKRRSMFQVTSGVRVVSE